MVSIAVVVLDTLRYDRFDQHFDWLGGIRYLNAYSTSHWTIPAHASIFTGHYGSEVGAVAGSEDLPSRYDTIAQRLQMAGYRTRMVSANPQLTMWNGWKRGFDQVFGPSDLEPGEEDLIDWEKFTSQNSGFRRLPRAILKCLTSDGNTIRELKHGVETLRRGENHGAERVQKRLSPMVFDNEKEFLFVNLMDVHGPYDPPNEYQSTNKVPNPTITDALSEEIEDREIIRKAYDDCSRYLSDVYKQLHSDLMADFDYVITLSDHGELLGEHGLYNHNYGVYPEMTHIPIQISGQDIEDGQNPSTVSLLDVHQTIAALADISVDSRGRNLLDEPKSQPWLTEYHGLTDWLIDSFEENGIEYSHLTDPLHGIAMEDGRYLYPSYSSDIDDDQAENLISDIVSDLRELDQQRKKEDISEETLSQLEDLGYA